MQKIRVAKLRQVRGYSQIGAKTEKMLLEILALAIEGGSSYSFVLVAALAICGRLCKHTLGCKHDM